MTITESKTATQPRRRQARGPQRPRYLQAEDIDHLLQISIALMAEVSALRDRLDTHELLAARGTVASAAAVEAFKPDEAQRELREQRRQAMLKRTLRVVTGELESATRGDTAE